MYDVELKCTEVLKCVDIWMRFREEVYIVGETSGEVFSLLQGEATSVPCEEWYSHVSVCNGGLYCTYRQSQISNGHLIVTMAILGWIPQYC